MMSAWQSFQGAPVPMTTEGVGETVKSRRRPQCICVPPHQIARAKSATIACNDKRYDGAIGNLADPIGTAFLLTLARG
jgi:hypothetical protein